jgi:multicomponent Na+:H+ antiporter subunit E
MRVAPRISPRIALRVVALVVLWLLAWGTLSVASVLSGVLVAVVLLLVFPPGPPTGVHFHPLGIGRLAGYVVVQLVISNLVMARQILRWTPELEPGVLAHHLQRPSAEVLTAMTTVIALSPGTMTVDTTPDSSAVYVHFLFLHDVDAARAGLVRLERLVLGAIGPDPRSDVDPTGAHPVPEEQP